MLKYLIAALFLLSAPAAIAGGITDNFFPAPNSTLVNTATTGGVVVTFTAGASLGAGDILVQNNGSVLIYCDIGLASAGFTATTVPTNTVPGGFALYQGQSKVFNKRANDTVACITPTGSSLFSATPGIGK